MTNTATLTDRKEQTAQFRWTLFVLSFFLIQAVLWTVAISITANDHSHAVVAGYDQKALHWDEERAAQIASDQLGWTVVVSVDQQSDIESNRCVTITLNDRTNAPITDASITLSAFHLARAADVQSVALKAIGDGRYQGTVKVRKPGLWLFDGMAQQGQGVYLIKQRTFVGEDQP